MRIGTLDRRVALQRKGSSYSNTGQKLDVWSTLVERWASTKPVQGYERNTAAQWVAREQTQFIIRWSAEISDLSPVDRIVFPAGDAANSPEVTRSIYDIITVHEQGRKESLLIMAARRVG